MTSLCPALGGEDTSGHDKGVRNQGSGRQGLGECVAPSGGSKVTKLDLVWKLESRGPALSLGLPSGESVGLREEDPLAFQHTLASPAFLVPAAGELAL